MCTIIGRKKESEELRRFHKSGRPEFVAVYGRRRVGKTFLIDEVFRDDMVFHHTGLSPYDRKRKVTMKDQLQNFYFSLLHHGMEGICQPKSWMEAFFYLRQFLERENNGSRQVVFIDELPWMDTPRSGFLTALESFWNGWGNMQHQLCLVVCGSATSWMLDNLINNKGGLYGRLTGEMKLRPFTLKECEDFYQSRGISMTKYNVLQAYMVMGGIPYYMNLFNPSLSLAQNIDRLFFERVAKLGDEFERLFNSVFDNAEVCMSIIRHLGKRHAGFSRDEIARAVGISANGDFTKTMKALIGSDFVTRYRPLGSTDGVDLYKLSDPFCWFWLHFKETRQVKETDYWQHHLQEPEIASWRGIAFEEVCWLHICQIKNALQIGGVASTESALVIRGDETTEGMQLDLVIDRQDDVVNICEMKYNRNNYVVTKAYAQTIRTRAERLEQMFPRKTIHNTLISAMPMERNEWSDVFQSAVTIEDW